MTDATSRTKGNVAPASAAARAFSASLLGRTATGQRGPESAAAEMNRGYSTAMGRGLELAVTLLVMVGIGLALDSIFDTRPLFTIILSVLGFAGITVKLWLGYDLEMRKHEEGAVWNRKSEGAS